LTHSALAIKAKARLHEKMGNLALTNSCNQLTISNIHKMSTCRLFEKFTATSRQRLGQPQNKEASPKGRLERARAAARSPREDQALPLRGPLPLVPRAVSPHRGNLTACHMLCRHKAQPVNRWVIAV